MSVLCIAYMQRALHGMWGVDIVHVCPLLAMSLLSLSLMACSNCYCVDGVNDSSEFEVTLNAMRSVGMGNSQIQAILSLVAAVLHLGNVEFRPQQVGGVEGCTVARRVGLFSLCAWG